MSKLNLVKFFEKIYQLSYVLIKVDTPYMPKDFPENYPNKDMDIIVLDEDVDSMKEEVVDFCSRYSSVFEMKVIPEDTGTRYRLYLGEIFHYQFDVSTDFFQLPLWFVRQSIQKAISVKGYHVSPIEYEIVYRLVAFHNKSKPWHLDYIRENSKSVDINLLERLSFVELFNEYTK